MAITYVQTLSIPGPSRPTNWLFSDNVTPGANIVLRARGGDLPFSGIVGYAALVAQIDGQAMFLPSMPLQVFAGTPQLLQYDYAVADSSTFDPFPNYVAIWVFDFVQGGFIDVGIQNNLVYLARF